MPLSAGDKLGPYEILGSIGAGGMGEVYRAHDTRLRRDVAIKVSAERFSERFETEARAIASLNHPNVCTLHDVGPNYLVMELVEGETLAERITQGAIPLDEALGIAKQIADALEAAHEKGITHRDLKPGNIKIKPDGVVKVLDFGLAKMGGTSAVGADSPTFTMQSPTQAGVILGTAAYMAPEQARGKPIDRRADIWAFGVVLYEMLSGRQAFAGETMTDVLASVVKEQPDLDVVPAHIRPVVARCLSKDPRARWGDIGDVRWLLEAGQPEQPAAASRSRLGRVGGMAGWIAAALATLLAGVALWAPWRTAPQPDKAVRFQVPLPEKLMASSSAVFSLSPDGSKLAYSAIGSEGTTRLWVRAMDGLESRPLPGTESTNGTPAPPFWSPDSRWIVFGVSNRLKKIDVGGGPPQTLCDLSASAVGGTWNRDGVILVGNLGGAVMRIPATGGVPSPVTALDASRKESIHRYPFFLPDGRHFLYLRSSSVPENTGIYLGTVDAKPEQQGNKRLVATDYGAVFVPSGDGKTGELLFLREGTLLSQPFDLVRLESAGEPIPLAEEVGSYAGFGFFSASTNGTLIYRVGTSGRNLQMTWFDRQGKMVASEGEPGNYSGGPALSPDGRQAAVVLRDRQPSQKSNLWLLDFARSGAATRFTFGGANDRAPVWSPDGSRIAFSSNREGVYNLYRKLTSGAKDEEVLLKSDQNKTPLSWSRDGRFLLFEVNVPKTGRDLWILPEPGGEGESRKPMLFQGTEANEPYGQFSPDGRWIAYMSDESGRYEVYVREFLLSPDGSKPEATAKRQISSGGGSSPNWREDGKELIYYSLDRKTVMSAEIATKPVFRAETPRVVCQLPVVTPYAPGVTADGKRFLAAIPVQGAAQEPFTVVLNWRAGLKK
jgi:serine/threonine protein kinase/Tol biopolymer transport system component